MVQAGQITLYSHPYSPYGHRAHLALEEVKADYTFYTLNVMNKPEWYPTVNPAGKIPAITYGGPKTTPENILPESAKIAESLVILEFLAELFPESSLHPKDLVKRARARFVITVFDQKVFEGFKNFVFLGAPPATLFDALAEFQGHLPETGFAVGDWSIADVAAIPFLVRLVMLLENDLGNYPAGEGRKAFEVLKSPKYARLWKYIEDSKERPSFKATYNEEEVLAFWASNPAFQRK